MLCQNCGKNEAEIHFVQTVNGDKTEALLCAKCAAERGFATQISFTNFMQSLMDAPSVIYPGASANVQCDNCGMTLREIKKDGKAGCEQCYKTFAAQIEAIIKNVQAGNAHTGKHPKKAKHISVSREISALRKKLAKAVELEEYELAASIRDEIRALEGGV